MRNFWKPKNKEEVLQRVDEELEKISATKAVEKQPVKPANEVIREDRDTDHGRLPQYKRYHHESYWYYQNLQTGEEVRFDGNEEGTEEKMIEFEKDKTIVYD